MLSINKSANGISDYINRLKAKQEISAALNNPNIMRDQVLSTHETFYDHMFDLLIEPNLALLGDKYKYDMEFKTYIDLLKDQDYYKKLKSEWKNTHVKEQRK